MGAVNNEVKKIISRAKKVQGKLQEVLKNQDWVEEAKKYADKQKKEVKKLLNTDTAKLKAFLERERKHLERLQNQLPGEIAKWKDFAQKQRQELKTLLTRVKKAQKSRVIEIKSTGSKKKTTKKTSK